MAMMRSATKESVSSGNILLKEGGSGGNSEARESRLTTLLKWTLGGGLSGKAKAKKTSDEKEFRAWELT